MSSTLAIQLSIWMLMCNLSIRECKANEPAPVTELLQSLQKADTIFDTPNSASSVQQAKEDRTRASDSNDDPSTWNLSLVIPEPVYQFVPFSLTARILDKNDKELHTNDWSPIFKTTKCIHRVKEDAVIIPDKYVATEPGECNLECEDILNSGKKLVDRRSLTVQPVSFKLKASLSAMNRNRIAEASVTLESGSRVNFHLEVQDERNQSVYVPGNISMWWSLRSEVCYIGGTKSEPGVTITEGPVVAGTSVQMPFSPGLVLVYHRATIHRQNEVNVSAITSITARQTFRVIRKENARPNDQSSGHLHFVFLTDASTLTDQGEQIKPKVYTIIGKQYPELTVCGLEVYFEKSKAHVQMDTISSSRDVLMRAIHRFKESARWNEVDLSPNGEHFKIAFLSFKVEDTKPSSTIELSLEDETPYNFSNMMDIKKYNFHVSSRLLKHDSVRPIPRGLLGLGSVVESKLQLTFRMYQWVEIPENSNYWWTFESEMCSTKSVRQQTSVPIKKGNPLIKMLSRLPSRSGVVYVYHRATYRTHMNENSTRELQLNRQAFRVGKRTQVLTSENLIELVRFVIPTSGSKLIGQQEKVRDAIRLSIEDKYPKVKVCGLEVNADQPNVRIQMHLFASTEDELKNVLQRLKKSIDQYTYNVVVNSESFTISPDSFQAMNAITHYPRYFKKAAAEPIQFEIEISSQKHTIATGTALDLIMEVRDEQTQLVHVNQDDDRWWNFESEICSTESLRQESSMLIKNGYARSKVPLELLLTSGVAVSYYRVTVHTREFGFLSKRELPLESRELLICQDRTGLADRNSFGRMQFLIFMNNNHWIDQNAKIRSAVRSSIERRHPTVLVCGMRVTNDQSNVTVRMDLFASTPDELANVIHGLEESVERNEFTVLINDRHFPISKNSIKLINRSNIKNMGRIQLPELTRMEPSGRNGAF